MPKPHEEIGSPERILHEATRLFAELGYEGTSLRLIAEAVGMQKGSLVYHFASKENIREAVLDGLISRWRDILPQVLLAAASGENRFERMMAEATGFFLEDPNRARLLMRECLDHPAELRDRIEKEVAPWLEVVAEAIATGQKREEIYADVDPMAYIWQVVLLVLASVAVLNFAPGLLRVSENEATVRLGRELIRIARTSLFQPGVVRQNRK